MSLAGRAAYLRFWVSADAATLFTGFEDFGFVSNLAASVATRFEVVSLRLGIAFHPFLREAEQKESEWGTDRIRSVKNRLRSATSKEKSMWPKFECPNGWSVAINPDKVAYLRDEESVGTIVFFAGCDSVTISADLETAAKKLYAQQIVVRRA